MSDTVLVAIIGLLGTACGVGGSIIGQVIISRSKARETDAKEAVREQKQQDALDTIKDEMKEIKKRLDQHNGYAEKFASASKDIALIQKDVEYLKKQK